MTAVDALPTIPMDQERYWHDPYPILRELREHHRVARTPQGALAVLHWTDGFDAVRGSQFTQEGMEQVERLGFKRGDPFWMHRRGAMGILDGDSHRRVRSVASAALSKRKMDRLRPLIRDHANALLDNKIADGAMEVCADFARRLPKLVMQDYMGVDEDEIALTMPPETASSIIDAFSPNATLSQEMRDKINASVQAVIANTEQLYDKRRRQPRDDLLSQIIQAEREQGALSTEERVNLFSVIFGSGTTTAATIASGLLELARHPEQAEMLGRNPDRYMRGASEESLRYHPAVNQITQKAADGTHAFGLDVPAGTPVAVITGSVNRDDQRWPDADRFDITRDPSTSPLTFGFGPHVCLGHAMARATVEEALAVFVSRCHNIRLLEKPRRVPFAMENKVESLKLGVEASPHR